jgi:hypothetical protein
VDGLCVLLEVEEIHIVCGNCRSLVLYLGGRELGRALVRFLVELRLLCRFVRTGSMEG